MRGLRDAGAVAAHPDPLRHAGVGDLHQDLAVAGLDHGTADHRREQPEHGLDPRAAGELRDRDPVHHRHPGALVQAAAHLAQQVAAGVELVVRGVEQPRRHRVALERARQPLDLVEAARRQRDPPVALANRATGPGARAGDRLADHGRRRVSGVTERPGAAMRGLALMARRHLHSVCFPPSRASTVGTSRRPSRLSATPWRAHRWSGGPRHAAVELADQRARECSRKNETIRSLVPRG